MGRVVIGLSFAVALLAISSTFAQGDRSEANARLTATIQARIESQRPVRLFADTITLIGDTLRLTGRASIRFDDTSIRAEEIVVNQVTKRVELLGNVRAIVGSEFVPTTPPRIEFR